MRRLLIVAFLVAGCGTDTPPTPPYAVSAPEQPTDAPTGEPTEEPAPEPEARRDPTVVAQGFTADGESDLASYAVVIGNPNATWVPRFVDVSVTFLDVDGTELATATQTIPGLLPESETAVAGGAFEAGHATDMVVQITSRNGLPSLIRSSLEEAGQYGYEGVQTSQDPSGGTTTTGVVLSRFDSAQNNVPIHVVYYDSAREIVGGAVTSVDEVLPGGQAAFEASTVVTIPDIAETRVFGHIGFGS